MFDDVKGYEFMVPQGTDHKSQTVDGVDVYMASVPAPYDIGVMVVAFKDKTIGKEELLKRAENILKAFDEKDIKIEPAKELSDDYSIATFTSTGKDGKAGKGKILVRHRRHRQLHHVGGRRRREVRGERKDDRRDLGQLLDVQRRLQRQQLNCNFLNHNQRSRPRETSRPGSSALV